MHVNTLPLISRRQFLPWRALLPLVATFAFLCAFFWAPALEADWLITQNGERIETKGPFKVEGRRVLYTRPNDTLAAVRLSEIDLEATERYAEELRNPRPKAKKKTRSNQDSKLVLDGSNVSRFKAPRVRPGEAAADAQTGVVVSSWKEVNDAGYELEVRGTVVNNTAAYASNVEIRATAYDESGKALETLTARPQKRLLGQGESTTFYVKFPGIFMTNDMTFEVKHQGVVIREPADDPGGEQEGR